MKSMTKILFVSDVHIGIRYSYRIDFKTGLSERTLDFVEALARVVESAIANQIDIFVICGDLFDRVHIGPTLLRVVRDRIWKPLIKHEIPLVLIGGNHDTPQIIEKGTPFGEASLVPESVVERTPQVKIVKGKYSKEEIGFVLLPYMSATQAITYAEKYFGEKIQREQYMIRGQEFFKAIIENLVNRLNTKTKVIVGHFYIQGSKIGIIPFPDQLPHEFIIKKEMLPLANIDIAVFGHIHTPQTLFNEKVIIPGSLEQVDFGESNEDKGFYLFDTKTSTLEFISNSPRQLRKHDLTIPNEIENPTEYIISHIPKNIQDSIFRLQINLTQKQKDRVMIRKILPILEKSTFYCDLIWNTQEKQREIVLPSVVLNPLNLYFDFIEEKYSKYKYKEKLKEKGQEILELALSKVEENQ